MSTANNNRMEARRPSTLVVNNTTSIKEIPSQTQHVIEGSSYSPLELSPNKPVTTANITHNSQSTIKIQELMNLFKPTEPQTRSYRETIEEIVTSFTMMDSLTNKLEEKVDLMLHNQKLEFIESYKRHMNKVKEEFEEIEKRIQSYEQKILYYENEGEMSHLIIKVSKLEEECKKLYKDLGNKEKVIKDNELTMKVQRSEIKRYEKELKSLMREKNELMGRIKVMKKSSNDVDNEHNNIEQQQQESLPSSSIKPTHENEQHNDKVESINSTHQLIFPTEFELSTEIVKNDPNNKIIVGNINNNNKRSQQSLTLDLETSEHNNRHTNFINDHYHKSITNIASPSQNSIVSQHLTTKIREQQLKKEITILKKKNQLLTHYQSHILEANTSLESFFISCVNEIKQQIKIKKKINYEVTFEEWKKEDKIELLIKVLSNDEVLVHLYERLFRKKKVVKDGNGEGEITYLEGNNNLEGRVKAMKSLYEMNTQKDVTNRKLKEIESKEKLLGLMKDKHIDVKESRKQKALSVAKKRVSKHISENSLLPKIHFHLEY